MNLSNIIDSLSNLSWSKATEVALITGFSIFVWVLHESYTHSIRIDRSERALSLAKNAKEYRKLLNEDITPEQEDIYMASIRVAKEAATEKGIDSPLTEQQLKFICGFFPWLLMAFVYVSNADKKKYIGMFGAILFGLFVASIHILVPRFWWPYGNLILLPTFSFICIFVFLNFVALYFKKMTNLSLKDNQLIDALWQNFMNLNYSHRHNVFALV